MKTRIMHLISHLKMGGAETLITEYALNINKQKFDVVIVTINGKNNTINEKKLKDKGIKVIYLGDKVFFPNAKSLFKRIINKVHRYFLIFMLFKKEKFDVIHSHLYVNEYLLPLKIKRNKVRLFYTVHSEINALFGKRRLKNRLLMNFFIKHKGMTPIALHSRMQKEMELLFNINNCRLIPNAIDLDRFKKSKYNKQEILSSLNINEEMFIVGHIGRFAEVKNHSFLIKLFSLIRERNPNSHLLLIGTGKLESQIKEQVFNNALNDSVSFLGNRSDIPELMSIIDVFLFPSLHEGFGNVLIEAQAAGVKCVVSDTVPNETHLTDLVYSLSLDDSLETWYKVIVSNKKGKIDKSKLEKHDIANVIKKIEDLYQE